MPGVTKEQIKAAKKMTAIEFLRRYRPEELVKGECRNEYQLREHDSFKINGETSLWHWKSRDVGGRSALDYLFYPYAEKAPHTSPILPSQSRKRNSFCLRQQKTRKEYLRILSGAGSAGK